MASVDYASLADDLLPLIGGKGNVASIAHCATRLRLQLKDASKADKAAIQALPGVITVVQAGGQYQIVVGDNVPITHDALAKLVGVPTDDGGGEEDKPKGSLLSRAIELITSIIHPLLWTLAGAGLFKAMVVLVVTLGWLDPASTTHMILNAASDAVFYFLPVFLAVTAARRFKANEFTAMAIAGGLVYPDIVALTAMEGPVTFMGIPVVVANYTSSLIPIILAVWIQGYLERLLKRSLPSAIRNFMTPLIVLLVMLPLTLLTVGPLTMWLSGGISSGVNYLFGAAPWAAGLILGGFWQVLVIFGLHWGMVPLIFTELASPGYSAILGPLLPAVLGMSAAMLGVFVRTRSKSLKQIAGPATLSGMLSGVTEPGVYGVTLPKRKPFIAGCIGGAVGGLFAAIGGSAANAFVFPSGLALPAFLSHGSFTMLLIGCGIAIAIGFGLTLVLGFEDKADDEPPASGAGEQIAAVEPKAAPVDKAPAAAEMTSATAAAPAAVAVAEATTVGLLAPMAGRAVALTQVDDAVFASEAMGKGLGIVPSAGTVVAPIAGKLVVVHASGHAYGIKGDAGVDVLIHVGIDTVQLEGKHFTTHVEKGQRVEPGDLLAEVDLDGVKTAGFDTTTMLIVTNTPKHETVDATVDQDVTTQDDVLRVTPKNP